MKILCKFILALLLFCDRLLADWNVDYKTYSNSNECMIDSAWLCSGSIGILMSDYVNCTNNGYVNDWSTDLIPYCKCNPCYNTGFSSHATGYEIQYVNRSYQEGKTCACTTGTAQYRCAANYYGENPTANSGCALCPDNSTSRAGTTAISGCTCNANYYRSGDTCLACPTNSTSTAGSTSCTCNANYYGNGTTSCTACPDGGTSTAGSTSKTACSVTCSTYLGSNPDTIGTYTATGSGDWAN